MDKASHYLEPEEHSERKTYRISQKDVEKHREEAEKTLQELEHEGIDTDPPETRSECPTQRPCPYVSCKYHLALDITSSGSLKFNYDGIDAYEVQPSCALDIADENFEGLPLSEIGDAMRLTRERVRQIEHQALEKVRDEHGSLKDLIQDYDTKETAECPDVPST